MRKTLLASAVVAAIAAPAAQAVSLHQSAETSVDLYGRLVLELQTRDDTSEIADSGSRLGFSVTQNIAENLTAYGNIEFRFEPDERRGGSRGDVFTDLRNSYIGVRGDFGDVRFGNFDSVYYQLVSRTFDVPENRGYVSLDKGDRQSRGDAVSYQQRFGDLRVAVQLNHQPADEDQSQKLNAQAALSYQFDKVAVGFGINQDKEGIKNGRDELIIGTSVSVQATDTLKVYGLLETQKDNRNVYALGGSFNYGRGDLYSQVALEDFDQDGVDDLLTYVVGANYKFSRAFYVYTEYADTDADGDNWQAVVGARLNF